jgi:C4-dicarboxylate transporter DctM subunit
MNPIVAGSIGIAVLLVLFCTGMPISFAMAITGLIGFSLLVSPEAAASLLAQEIFQQFASYALGVIPLFVIMGYLALAAGIGEKAYQVTHVIIGQVRGGLCMASIAASAIFGAVCGSAAATCATIGGVALPEMKRYNYDDALATGAVASAGGLGIMIPPSTAFIIYGILTEQSITKLFISGILPGIMLTVLMMMTVSFLCWRNPQLAPVAASSTLKQKLIALAGLTDVVILFLLSMGGMFAGWFSPTQAGAIGGAGAILIGLARRKLRMKAFVTAIRESARISCMILLLIAGALIFGRFLAVTGMNTALVEYLRSVNMPPILFVISICAVFFVLGCFVDMFALIVLLVPTFYPVILDYGYDPLWFGVIIVLLGMIGIITPPVAVDAFVVSGISGVPLETVYKGVIPFLVPLVVGLIIIILFPQISTFLPSLISR